jgi:heavy metal sensor kinase
MTFFSSIRFKISILYTLVLGLILLAYSTILYMNLQYVIYNDIDKELTKRAQAIENTMDKYAQVLEPNHETVPKSLSRTIQIIGTEPSAMFETAARLKDIDKEWKYRIYERAIHKDYIIVYYPTGDIAEQSNNVEKLLVPILHSSLDGLSFDVPSHLNIITELYKFRVYVYPIYREGRLKYVLQVATNLEETLFILRSRIIIIYGSIPVVLIITSFIGRFFVKRVLRPITGITRATEAITHKDLSKRLEQRLSDIEIRSLVNALNDMLGRLDQAFKYIEDFSSDVAHELKTPLAIIRGESEIALRKERDIEEYKRVITVNVEESERMLKTIDDLLLLTKLDYQAHVFKFELVQLNDFMAEIYEQAKIISVKKNIEVELFIPKKIIYIEANRLHLRRLFFNLINNAIKFTPDYGKISLDVKRDQKKAVVTVTDTGIGIPKEDLPRIFDRFFHRDRTATPTGSASGLGLSIVQSIAALHKGTVNVLSEVGRGTTFIVTLPMKD